MAAIPFSYAYQDQIAGSPLNDASIIVYSTDDADNMNITLQDQTLSNAEVVTLDGNIEQESVGTYDELLWAILESTAAGTVVIRSTDGGIAAIGDVRVDSLPIENDTLTIGVGSHGTVYTFKAAPALANEIQIGADLDDQANQINLTLLGIDGRSTANAFVSSSQQGSVVTITDKIACHRFLPWAVSESASNFSIRQPIGGQNGTLLTQISAGEAEAYQGNIELDTEDSSDPQATLPPGKVGPTDSVSIGGRRVTIDHVSWSAPSGAITMKYESSNDGENWRDGLDALANPSTSREEVTPTEHIQFIRLNILTNAATTATPLNCKVIF